MVQETDKKTASPKFGTKASQDELARSLQALKERVDTISSDTADENKLPSRYSKPQGQEFKITRGYGPATDDQGDLSLSRNPGRPAGGKNDLDRIPAQKMIKEAEKRIKLLQSFSQNTMQLQVQQIQLESANESFEQGDFPKAKDVAEHILSNLNESFMKQVHNETAKGISQAYSTISGARMLGIDVAQANKRMEDAQNSFLDDDYSTANRIINEVVSSVNHEKKEYLTVRVEDILKAVDEALSSLPKDQVEKTGIRGMISRARSLFKRGNLDDAYILSNQCHDLARKMHDIYNRGK